VTDRSRCNRLTVGEEFFARGAQNRRDNRLNVWAQVDDSALGLAQALLRNSGELSELLLAQRPSSTHVPKRAECLLFHEPNIGLVTIMLSSIN
jgi:hypothetical protein